MIPTHDEHDEDDYPEIVRPDLVDVRFAGLQATVTATWNVSADDAIAIMTELHDLPRVGDVR